MSLAKSANFAFVEPETAFIVATRRARRRAFGAARHGAEIASPTARNNGGGGTTGGWRGARPLAFRSCLGKCRESHPDTRRRCPVRRNRKYPCATLAGRA